MQTILSRFAHDFDAVARPLLAPVSEAADVLDGVSDELAVRAALPHLRDLDHRLRALADKVAEQQAYVLIFGPLKSGKSTLMNAIAAAYVSEVTTLPAYPCMVYVRHAPQRTFEVTRYDGSRQAYASVADMREQVARAHADLAEAIRAIEARGGTFDPAVHAPQAIRRLDVRVPAPDLAESSAVLVDTPGLYTRMKFGYDRMTREFRDTAACAIFVVKTDNLFLEQVFDEFGELLELFSRIFLLVNVDSTKLDLRPDGELVPSLEAADPDRIVAAFESLAMSAPLKAAREEGRLRIYPVDLLRAASRRLRSGAGQPALFDADGGDTSPGDACGRFLQDLTDYLNSTDYLAAFLRDSLRQATRLLGELHELCGTRTVASLGAQVERLEAEREQCQGVRAGLERLGAFAWRSAFGQLGEDLRSIVTGRLSHRREETVRQVGAAVDAWYQGDGSFGALHEQHVGPILGELRGDLLRTAHGVLDTVAGNETAGAELPGAIREDVVTARLSLSALGKRSVASVDAVAVEGRASLAVTTAHVPVRRRLLDWLLFRTRARVRRKLFGPVEAPDRPVPAAVKARRIRETGRDELRRVCLEQLERCFDDDLKRLAERMLEAYVGTLRRAVDEALAALGQANDEREARIERRLTEMRAVLAKFEVLGAMVRSRRAALGQLVERYGDGRVTEEASPSEDDRGAPAEAPSSGPGLPARGG